MLEVPSSAVRSKSPGPPMNRWIVTERISRTCCLSRNSRVLGYPCLGHLGLSISQRDPNSKSPEEVENRDGEILVFMTYVEEGAPYAFAGRPPSPRCAPHAIVVSDP